MQIPLLDLKRQYKNIEHEANQALLNVLQKTSYIMGENVVMFEKEFGEYIGTKHAISVANGTDALVIALRALNIGAGDEVITSPFTFFATAEAISYVGATPVFVDVRPDTYNIDESKIEASITSKTKAIMPVHIFGQCCNMSTISQIAKKHNLYIIEDACQAAGAMYNQQMAGSFGDISCFSFFPTKNLGCAGDGGMICTNHDHLAILCKALRNHGSGENGQQAAQILNQEAIQPENTQESNLEHTIYYAQKYYNYLIGQNSRLDEIQAALLRIKLRKLPEYIQLRRMHAQYYQNQLQDKNYVLPIESEENQHSYHLFILQSENRTAVTQSLAQKGIATGIYYPVPLHLQACYINLNYKNGAFPIAEYLSARTFAIPLFPEITAEECEYIVQCL